MKLYRLMLLLCIGTFALVSAHKYDIPERWKTAKGCQESKDCWCSMKCGPRQKKSDADMKPIFRDDPEGTYCYCQHRDFCQRQKNCGLK
jgi:hypothetical protein